MIRRPPADARMPREPFLVRRWDRRTSVRRDGAHTRSGNRDRARPAPGCDRRCGLTTVGGMLTVLLQHLGHDVLRSRTDCRTTVPPSSRCPSTAACIAPSITEIRIAAPKRSQKCRSTSPGKSRAAELVGAGRGERHDDARRRARLGPQHEHARRALPHLPARLADELGAALEQHDRAVGAEGVGRESRRSSCPGASSRSRSRACSRETRPSAGAAAASAALQPELPA